MGIFQSKQTYQPVNRVIIFEDRFCNVEYVREIRDGCLITTNGYVLPVEDSTVFNSDDGLVYAFNVSLEYKKEIEHLGEVEKNIIISQAFLYPGSAAELGKSNMITYFVGGVLALIAIVAIFV